MRAYWVIAAVAAALAAGCGDDGGARPDAGGTPLDLLQRLRAMPGVHDAEEQDTQTAGYRYFVLHFEQPVDHDDPGGQTFLQEVSLLHRDLSRPMIAWTSGYWDYYRDHTVELTNFLLANQISIEHRFFAGSRPDPADWSKLTIEQMAADQHAIITAFRTLYGGKYLTSGGSKGGMTAVYHRRFYPDDVDGTVPYVAPISFGAPDTRYVPFLDTLGSPECRQAVRDAATEILQHRRAAMLTSAETQATADNLQYTRIQIGPAVESAIVSLEWAFWQYYGINSCSRVPAVTATDDAMWKFLDAVSPPSDNADASIAEFDAYYYQAYNQLGFPDGGAEYLDPYLVYTDADYLMTLPAAQPAYDGGAAMADIDAFVRERGDRFLFVYGEWDPWTGGTFELGGATDSLRAVQLQGTHGSKIQFLEEQDQQAAVAKLKAWTGVEPMVPISNRRATDHELREPRVPPAMQRALRARQISH